VNPRAYKRLALCEIEETSEGQIIKLKIEKPIDLEAAPPLANDDNYELHLYTRLDELREGENYVDYHNFCMFLIEQYVHLRDSLR